MSINGQIMATMEEEGILNDEGLSGPQGAPQPNPPQVTTSNPLITAQTPVTDALKKEILAPNTVYKSMVNNVESVTTMEEVAENIATQDAISFADAKEVAMTFEGFEKKVSVNEFTKSPSQVNLAFTKNFMAAAIRVRQEELKTLSEEYFDGQLAEAEDAFDDYKSFYGANLIETLAEFQPKVATWFSNGKSIPYQLVEHKGDYVNLATTPLEDFPMDLKGPGNFELFHTSVENLRTLSKENIHVKNLIKTISLRGTPLDFANAEHTAKAQIESYALVDFLKCFGNPYLKDFLVQFEQAGEQAVKDLNKLNSESGISPSDFKEVRDFIVKNGEAIDEAHGAIHYYVEVVELIQKLYLNVTVVLDYFTLD